VGGAELVSERGWLREPAASGRNAAVTRGA
jgi:hypothetical protein